MKKLLLACLLLGMLLATSAAFADTVSGTGGANWQGWVVGDVNKNGTPYWDQPSQDGGNKNIGYWLSGGPGFTVPGPGITPDYWGNATGTADANFFFNAPGNTNNAALKIEIAGLAGSNQFGWYVLNPDNTLGTQSILFSGGNGAGAVATFTPGANTRYGFFLEASGKRYYTQSSFNALAEQSHQHFAAFKNVLADGRNQYYIGSEDQTLSQLGANEGGIGDYNDLVVSITPVPEPGTLLLIGSSMVGMMGLGFRRRRRLS